jgi:hypothetical protein
MLLAIRLSLVLVAVWVGLSAAPSASSQLHLLHDESQAVALSHHDGDSTPCPYESGHADHQHCTAMHWHVCCALPEACEMPNKPRGAARVAHRPPAVVSRVPEPPQRPPNALAFL